MEDMQDEPLALVWPIIFEGDRRQIIADAVSRVEHTYLEIGVWIPAPCLYALSLLPYH